MTMKRTPTIHRQPMPLFKPSFSHGSTPGLRTLRTLPMSNANDRDALGTNTIMSNWVELIPKLDRSNRKTQTGPLLGNRVDEFPKPNGGSQLTTVLLRLIWSSAPPLVGRR